MKYLNPIGNSPAVQDELEEIELRGAIEVLTNESPPRDLWDTWRLLHELRGTLRDELKEITHG